MPTFASEQNEVIATVEIGNKSIAVANLVLDERSRAPRVAVANNRVCVVCQGGGH
jgi:hypothetical protein